MPTSARFPWVTTSAMVSCVVVAAVAGLRVPEERSRSSKEASMPLLQLTRVDEVRPQAQELLVERLAAYDPTPLFLPSGMSSSTPTLPDEAGNALVSPFKPIGPKLTKTSPTAFPLPVAIPQSAVAGLRLTERAGAPLALGRAAEVGDLLSLGARLARVEVVDPGSGRTVLTLELPASASMPTQDWQPLELLGAISRAGTVGELVVGASSGLADVDEFFRVQLKERARVGAHLPEGFYVFRIGP